jgi:hypothetical protein
MKSFGRLLTLPDHNTCSDTATTLQTIWKAHFRRHNKKGTALRYTLQGLHFTQKKKWHDTGMWKCVESLHICLRFFKVITLLNY